MKEIVGTFKKHVKTLHLTGVILINAKSVNNVRNKKNKRNNIKFQKMSGNENYRECTKMLENSRKLLENAGKCKKCQKVLDNSIKRQKMQKNL